MNPVNKKSLIHTAIPTLFDVPNPPPRITPKRGLPKCQRTTPPVTEPLPQQSSNLPELPEAAKGN